MLAITVGKSYGNNAINMANLIVLIIVIIVARGRASTVGNGEGVGATINMVIF